MALTPRLSRLAATLIIVATLGCNGSTPAHYAVVAEFDSSARGPAPDRASLLGASGFERRHTLRPSQAALLVKALGQGGRLRGFEVNLFLGDFGEPALMEALLRGPLRIRVDERLLDRAKSGSAGGSEVRLRIGPDSRFESLDVDLPPDAS